MQPKGRCALTRLFRRELRTDFIQGSMTVNCSNGLHPDDIIATRAAGCSLTSTTVYEPSGLAHSSQIVIAIRGSDDGRSNLKTRSCCLSGDRITISHRMALHEPHELYVPIDDAVQSAVHKLSSAGRSLERTMICHIQHSPWQLHSWGKCMGSSVPTHVADWAGVRLTRGELWSDVSNT